MLPARGNTHTRIRKAGRETLRAVDQHKPGTRAPNPERAIAATERARTRPRNGTGKRANPPAADARADERALDTPPRTPTSAAAATTATPANNAAATSTPTRPLPRRRDPTPSRPRASKAIASTRAAPATVTPDPRRYPRGCQHDRPTSTPRAPRAARYRPRTRIRAAARPAEDRDRHKRNKPADHTLRVRGAHNPQPGTPSRSTAASRPTALTSPRSARCRSCRSSRVRRLLSSSRHSRPDDRNPVETNTRPAVDALATQRLKRPRRGGCCFEWTSRRAARRRCVNSSGRKQPSGRRGQRCEMRWVGGEETTGRKTGIGASPPTQRLLEPVRGRDRDGLGRPVTLDASCRGEWAKRTAQSEGQSWL